MTGMVKVHSMSGSLAWRAPLCHCVICLCVTFAAARACADPVAIDEHGLDGITAASAGGELAPPTGPRPDVDTGQSDRGDAGTTPDTGLVVESTIDMKTRNAIELRNESQSDARALNLVTAAGSDVAQGVNVIDRSARTVVADTMIEAVQRNGVEQLDLDQATLGRFATPGPEIERDLQASATTSELGRTTTTIAHVDRSITASTTTTRFQADVEPTRFGLFDDPVSLGGQDLILPDFQIGFRPIHIQFNLADYTGLSGSIFDVDVNVDINFPNLFNVSGARLRLGAVTLDGSDVILSAPQITLPDLTFSWCFHSSDCQGQNAGSKETLTIPGRTLSLGEIRLTDANPFGDVGFTFGYAIAGDGTITFESGGVELSGDIPINIGDLVLDGLGVAIPNVAVFEGLVGDLNLPTIQIPIDLSLDFPSPPEFNQSFSDEACTYSAGSQNCTPLDRTTRETNIVERGDVNKTEASESRAEAHSRIEYQRRRGEVELEHGQADLVVVRNSAAKGESYNVVIVADDAQSGMLTLNAVNAARAIVGSGTNVARSGATTLEQNAPASAGFSQTNSFRQVGGL